jgi:5-methylcytosine-specific restriction endonuclease McrA
MGAALEKLVWQRANRRCEYCQFPADISLLPFQLDHIIAEKHGGPTAADNLALCCERCNSAVQPATRRVVGSF